uniref:Replication protein E1 n=1 Tax=Human papillomavirus 40 TaxID=10615 RepID=A0A159DR41_HPV40|nr:E1 [human papillomavirus 40]WBM83952.1 E1 protein [human papillomavirus 40]CAD1807004.1 early protein [human papillomavirus 40]CAD1814323.1 early protein [human papillomavirus 40]
MADSPGTEDGGAGCSGWFVVEAVVDKQTGDAVSEDEDEEDIEDSGFDMIDFIDNSVVAEEHVELSNAQALLHVQQTCADAADLCELKRKYISPYVSPIQYSEPSIDGDLSPRLHAIRLGGGQKAKRRLFQRVEQRDSGYGYSEVETTERQVETEHGGPEDTVGGSGRVTTDEAEAVEVVEDGSHVIDHCSPRTQLIELFKCKDLNAKLYGKFKELYGVGFGDLVRQFKSDKSTCTDWVYAVFGVNPTIAEGFHTLLKRQALYLHTQWTSCKWGMVLLALCRYKVGKNRETVVRQLSKMLNVPENQILVQPPKLQSPPAALFWFRAGMGNGSEVSGTTPEWIAKQTMLEHSFADTQFSLTDMVQWAYDNGHTDECEIAYYYAQRADVDANAAAFLKSNNQAKYVRDCASMCKHYRLAEMRRMSMAEWIKHRGEKCDEGDWKPIVKLLRYQHIDIIVFLAALKKWLQGIPKKNCICIVGPPDTGKSCFGMSLMHFMQGTIISYVNSCSHFWLQSLADAKVAMLDDVTAACWGYMDTHMRNLLDGNPTSIDRKHKPLAVIKCPPLLLTSNINITQDSKYQYLQSRVQVFEFPNPFPFDSNGNAVYELNDANWNSFFKRLASSLELQTPEDEDGESSQAPRFVPGTVVRTV